MHTTRDSIYFLTLSAALPSLSHENIIDNQLYRFRIGVFTHNKSAFKCTSSGAKCNLSKNPQVHSNNVPLVTLSFIYAYFITILYSITASIIIDFKSDIPECTSFVSSPKLFPHYIAMLANTILVSLKKITINKRTFKSFSSILHPCWSNPGPKLHVKNRILKVCVLHNLLDFSH